MNVSIVSVLALVISLMALGLEMVALVFLMHILEELKR